MNRLINSVVFCLLLLPALSYGERNLALYTTNEYGDAVTDPYTSRNMAMNDSGRYVFASGPGQNVAATHGASGSMAIAYTDMRLQKTNYIISNEFNTLIEDEPNIDASADGRYLALRPSPGRASLYSSDASPLYLYDMVAKQLTPVIKSYNGEPLQGCIEEWGLHNWSRSTFASLRNELIYYSSCSNIVAGDTNGVSDLFIYDINTGTNRLLSQTVNSMNEVVALDGASASPQTDDSGRFVVFASQAKNIDANACGELGYQTFVLDRLDGSYTRITECEDARNRARDLNYGIAGDGSVVIASGKEKTPYVSPAVRYLNIYSTQNQTKQRLPSHYRHGAISLSHNGNIVAFTASAFYNFAGNYTHDVSAYGALLTWNRTTNTFVTHSNHYYTQQPVSTFVHDEAGISGGGDFVFFAGNSYKFWIEKIVGENSYHQYIRNQYVRNYRYVTIRGEHNGWSSFSNMRLTGDNEWTAEIITVNNNARFKFDVSGDWSENYGDSNGDFIGDFAGNDIVISGQAGAYRITFNDSTKAYSISALQQTALDAYLPSSNELVQFNCDNGFTQLGQSVYVVGSSPELGSWSVENAVLLAPVNYPLWSTTISIATHTQVEWKCVKRDEQNPAVNVEWQAGANNVLDTGVTAFTQASF